MFGIIITMLIFTVSPVEKELFLVDTIADKKIPYPYYGIFFPDIVIGDSAGS